MLTSHTYKDTISEIIYTYIKNDHCFDLLEYINSKKSQNN